MKRYVFDACALIAFFNDEPGADVVEKLLTDATHGKCDIVMNKYNLLEVYYGYLKANGEEFAENILSIVENSCIHVYDVLTDVLFRCAATFKASYRMSLADAMALAQASVEPAILVTADHHEMDALCESSTIEFLWIR